MVIRSYRRVFEVDRRIYRVDRWALPVPGGVPLRAVGYFAAALLAVIAAGELPGTGELALRFDGDDVQLHRGRARGPARVTFNVPVRLSDRGGRLVAHAKAVGEPGHAVVLCGGETMEVRP